MAANHLHVLFPTKSFTGAASTRTRVCTKFNNVNNFDGHLAIDLVKIH